LRSGIGKARWGYQHFLEFIGYTLPCHEGFALGISFLTNFGRDSTNIKVHLNSGYTETAFKLSPIITGSINAYYYIKIGSRSRLLAMIGYVFPLKEIKTFYSTYNPTALLSKTGEQEMRQIAPGGFAAGIGFSIGLFRYNYKEKK